MTSISQRTDLSRRIWHMANEVRGAVDGWDFKQYVLGTLFYRFLSENFTRYMAGGDARIHYAELPDRIVTPAIQDDAIKTLGYVLYPSQLFVRVAAHAHDNEHLATELAAIFAAIEASAQGYPSAPTFQGLFADFDPTSNRLGHTVQDKNARLATVLNGVADLDFGPLDSGHIDRFGEAYESLIADYAAHAGWAGGEGFTPHTVSKLITQLAMHQQPHVNKIYDPACGSGSLLLQASQYLDATRIEAGFFGQEIAPTMYRLAQMNLFLHTRSYDRFHLAFGDTLTHPHFRDETPFDVIVSHPPYSAKWIGSDDPMQIYDDRFAPAGVLAPSSKADFAFVLHALSYLSAKGRAVLVCAPSIFYRGGAEQTIRRYLVETNVVETVIALAPNLFFGTTTAMHLLVLSKHKADTLTQFIDARALFQDGPKTHVLLDAHIAQIVQVFDCKTNVHAFAQSVPLETIAANDYHLSVSRYVKANAPREAEDIA